MQLKKILCALTLSSCGQASDSSKPSETDSISAGLLIEGAGLVWELVGDRSELPQPIKFSAFPKDVALSEGKWFKTCEAFLERTILGFKAFEADLCISGYTNVNVLNNDNSSDPETSGFYLRDIRVKLEVKKIDPLWDVFSQGAFGDVYLKQLNPQVPAVDIYADFNLYSLIGLKTTYNRHYRIDGRGEIKVMSK